MLGAERYLFKAAHCNFKAEKPFKVTCTSDGKEVLNWSGDMPLGIEGCCKCPEESKAEPKAESKEDSPKEDAPKAKPSDPSPEKEGPVNG